MVLCSRITPDYLKGHGVGFDPRHHLVSTPNQAAYDFTGDVVSVSDEDERLVYVQRISLLLPLDSIEG